MAWTVQGASLAAYEALHEGHALDLRRQPKKGRVEHRRRGEQREDEHLQAARRLERGRELDDEGFAALDAEQDAVLALHNRAHLDGIASGTEHLELMRQEGLAGAGLGSAFHSAQE